MSRALLSRRRPVVAVALATWLVALVVTAGPVPADDLPGEVRYVPPVDAPVADGFRAPETPFGPGNRGLEYDTVAGTEVRASADGEVVFAGPVAGSQHLTLRHADGVRTSYSFLRDLRVRRGDAVSQGTVLGTTEMRLHFGARLGDHYFDPSSLFQASGAVEVELVPFEVPPGGSPETERLALRQMTPGPTGGLGALDVGDVLDWSLNGTEAVLAYAQHANPLNLAREVSAALIRELLFPSRCTPLPDPVDVSPVVRDRVAVTVGGLGSSSESASIDRLDLDDLGYASDGVVRFSYAGGRTPPGPGASASFAGAGVSTYSSSDTQGDVRIMAARLADLIQAIAHERAESGSTVAIDVYAHSMGGVVTRLALLELQERGFPLEHLGLVATLGSPHRGAPLAGLLQAGRSSVTGEAIIDHLEEELDTGLEPEAVAIEQLVPESPVMAELAAAGVPEGVNLISIGARGDWVVPLPQTHVDGARNVAVHLSGEEAHSDLVAADQTARELALAIAGRPPGCVGPLDGVLDVLEGHGILYAETGASIGAGALP